MNAPVKDPSIRTRTLIVAGLTVVAIVLAGIAMAAAKGFGL